MNKKMKNKKLQSMNDSFFNNNNLKHFYLFYFILINPLKFILLAKNVNLASFNVIRSLILRFI